MFHSTKGKEKQRDPPPSLFLGPPSQNASHVSLPGILIPGNDLVENIVPNADTVTSPGSSAVQRATLHLQRSQRLAPRSNLDSAVDAAGGAGLGRSLLPHQQQESEGRKQADRTDALWAKMQSTLEEVELSAVNGTNVFGQQHNKAVEDLRTTQIALAQAWARSEAGTAVEAADKESKVIRSMGLLGSEKGAPVGTDGAKSATNSAGGRPGSSSGAEKSTWKLEEETEADILLARKRREANDQYFQRVNGGVLEVVAHLEAVAIAMRAVEQDSRDIWSESESSVTSNNP